MTAPVIMMPDTDAVPALIDRRDVPTSLGWFRRSERWAKILLLRVSLPEAGSVWRLLIRSKR